MTELTKPPIPPRQIMMDIAMLRRGRGVWSPTVGERRFFGTVGFSVMAYAELANSMMALSVGWGLVTVAIIGVLQQRRRDRVRAWFEGVHNV